MTVVNTVPPAITGTAQRGQTLTTSTGTWTFDLAFLDYTYRWLRCDAAGNNCVAIPGATSHYYTLTAADVGSTIRSEVTATESQPEPPPPTIPLSAPAQLASVQASAAAGSVYALTGNFGNQTFTQNKAITFQAASPGSATLGNVTFNCGSGSIELKDLTVGVVTIGGVSVAPGGTFPASASDITLRDLDGARFNVHWAERISIIGGDWGLSTIQQAECRLAPWNPYDGSHVPTDVLVDGCYIHDFGMSNPTGSHSDGIQTWGMVGVVIRNCTFERIGGTGALTMEFLDYNYLPQSVKDILNANHSLFPSLGHVRIYNNTSLDTVQCSPTSSPLCAFYDVQQSQNIPDYDYTQVTNSNTWPRGVYNEPLFGQPQGTGYPWGAAPTPPTPPGWPPA